MTDEGAFAIAVHKLAETYAAAKDLAAAGVRVVCCDEKTSIEALEPLARTQPMARRRIERREFNYRRHGTTCLIANM